MLVWNSAHLSPTLQPIRTVFTNGFLLVFLDVVLPLPPGRKNKKTKQKRLKNKYKHLRHVAAHSPGVELVFVSSMKWFVSSHCFKIFRLLLFWRHILKTTSVHFVAKLNGLLHLTYPSCPEPIREFQTWIYSTNWITYWLYGGTSTFPSGN